MLALAATFVGFSAFKYTNKDKGTFESPQWYTVTVDNPSLPQDISNLRIINAADEPEEGTGDFCATDNSLDTCMVRINTENLSGPSDIENLTIQQAQSAGAPVLPQAGGDGYARSIE